MPVRLGALLVFLTAAAVLVIEIAAVRLLAPFVGQTLETFTAIVATILAGISAGTWLGGRLADRLDPRRIIVVELTAGGVAAMVSVPLVRAAGPVAADGGLGALVGVTALAILLPAALLSAVSPAVVKLTLDSLAETGSVVGTFSAVGTAGAIFGSVFTGFVLLATFATPTILIGLGALLVASGVALGAVAFRWRRSGLAAVAAAVAIGALAWQVRLPCDVETKYYCVEIAADATDGSVRTLLLDGLRHSSVDLEDPSFLGFTSTRMMAAVIETHTAGPVTAVHVGGGGFTMPRWLAATRPGSTSIVLELDPGVVDVAIERLDAPTEAVDVVIGDARASLQALPAGTTQVAIGDAFGGRAVPWHLTTEEFVAGVAEVLAQPGGIYVMNLIDGHRLEFVRSMAATVGKVFPHALVMSPPERYATGGNFVVAGSFGRLDASAIAEASGRFGLTTVVLTGSELDDFVGTIEPLTDDFAPVDQLLRP